MLLRQRVKAVTHVIELLNFVQDCIRVHEMCGFPRRLEKRGTSDGTHSDGPHRFVKLEKGFAVCLRNPQKDQQQDQAALSVHPVSASCANENIPSPRHRAKTTPQEQPIRFPLLYLTNIKRKLD